MSKSEQFLTAFKPLSLDNIDNVLSNIQNHENPFLAGFNSTYCSKISICFIFLNSVLCTLIYINTDIDSVLKFLSICTLFSLTSAIFSFCIYLIHKSKQEYFFIESASLTRDIKATYFYNKETLQSILKQIPLGMASMSKEQYQQLTLDCEHQCLKNKDIQMIYDMLKNEKYLEIKQKFNQVIYKYINTLSSKFKKLV